MRRKNLPRRRRLQQAILEPVQLIVAHHISQAGVDVIWIGCPVRAEVGEKDFEVLAKLLRPVHKRLIYGVELDQGPETSLNKIVGHGVILVQRFTKDFSEPPVVRYFVVVPLNIDGNF